MNNSEAYVTNKNSGIGVASANNSNHALENSEDELAGRRAASAFLAGEEAQINISRGQTLPRLNTEHSHSKHIKQPNRVSKAHEASRSGFSEFIWQDREVYRQRTWICRLAKRFAEEKETAEIGSPFVGAIPNPNNFPLRSKKSRRRKAALARMTPGSTLMSIGEAADSFHAPATGALKPHDPPVDVKAWPAFRAYKTTIASAQAARLMQKRPVPIVIKGGQVQKTQPKPVSSQPKKISTTSPTPTLARIVAQSTRVASPLLGAQSAPPPKPSSMDPLFPLHLARLAVIDGEESRACSIFESFFGLARKGPATNTSAPLKSVLLTKPKAWPVLLRIWLRALDRGMDELLLMLLGAGIPANPLQPIAFLAPKKSPPNPTPRFYSLAGLASSVSLLSTGSSTTAALGALGDWLHRSYRDWLLHRIPSFFLAAVAFGRSRLVKAMIEGSKRQASALAGCAASWLGLTPLCIAAASGTIALPKALVDAGADPAIGLPYYNWLLARRKLRRRPHSTSSKTKAGEDVITWIKDTPLFPMDCAVAKGNPELFLLLLSRSYVAATSRLALFVQSELDLTIKILKAGIAHPSISDPYGNRPLHYAAYLGKVDLVALFLHYGAPIDAVNTHGRTALHMAAHQGCSGALRCLLQAGADCSIKDDAGQTALEAARRHGFDSEQLADYLQSGKPSHHEAVKALSESTKALIEQVENYDLREDLNHYTDRPVSNMPQSGPQRPAQQRKGRFLIEKIINPRQWWA